MTIPTITTESILTKRRRAKFGPVIFNYHGTRATLTAEVRYDDDAMRAAAAKYGEDWKEECEIVSVERADVDATAIR